jgi:protocatechuate 3,4-dioxygenase beta subunit
MLSEDRHLRRREALLALGGLGLGSAWLAREGVRALTGPAATAEAASCILSKESTEGPYWIANHLTRRNITENRPGMPLRLHLTVLDAVTCKPIKGADVEIWHADAGGTYSGVQGNTKTFLRGHQKSAANGSVTFDTVYPGWYSGRTPHIHIKVHVGTSYVYTGQLFFSDTASAAIYRTARYKSHGQADTTNTEDSIYAGAGGGRARVALSHRKNGKGYLGRLSLGVTP